MKFQHISYAIFSSLVEMTTLLSDKLLNSTMTYMESVEEIAEKTTSAPQPIPRNYEGPLTPIHYIIIVLIVYMGGIAVLIMKSVQKENEVLRYQHYYENFVKRPQFNRPQLLPSYTLRKASNKPRCDRGSCTPSHVDILTEIGSSDVVNQQQVLHDSDSSISVTKLNKGFQTEQTSLIVVNAMPASTQTDPESV